MFFFKKCAFFFSFSLSLIAGRVFSVQNGRSESGHVGQFSGHEIETGEKNIRSIGHVEFGEGHERTDERKNYASSGRYARNFFNVFPLPFLNFFNKRLV